MKIGIIGAGNIGGTLGRLWIQAGHDVRFGVRDASRVAPLLAELGSNASVGTARDAAAFGPVLVNAGPYGAWPAIAGENAAALKGKVVIDAANPYAERDGDMAAVAARTPGGSGAYTAAHVPGARVVKAFNTVYWVDLRDKAWQAGTLLAMPMAGDDAGALRVVSDLAADAGFEPVILGGIDQSALLDPGSPIYAKSFTAAQVRAAIAAPKSHNGDAR